MKRRRNSLGQLYDVAWKWAGDVVELERTTGKTLESCVRAFARREGLKIVRIIRSRRYCIGEFLVC